MPPSVFCRFLHLSLASELGNPTPITRISERVSFPFLVIFSSFFSFRFPPGGVYCDMILWRHCYFSSAFDPACIYYQFTSISKLGRIIRNEGTIVHITTCIALATSPKKTKTSPLVMMTFSETKPQVLRKDPPENYVDRVFGIIVSGR